MIMIWSNRGNSGDGEFKANSVLTLNTSFLRFLAVIKEGLLKVWPWSRYSTRHLGRSCGGNIIQCQLRAIIRLLKGKVQNNQKSQWMTFILWTKRVLKLKVHFMQRLQLLLTIVRYCVVCPLVSFVSEVWFHLTHQTVLIAQNELSME